MIEKNEMRIDPFPILSMDRVDAWKNMVAVKKAEGKSKRT